jgi:hypothetical protein
MQKFTNNDLLLHYYHELDAETTSIIEASIMHHPAAQAEFECIDQTITHFATLDIEPDDRVLDRIMMHFSDQHSASVV